MSLYNFNDILKIASKEITKLLAHLICTVLKCYRLF
jgi:hypothetical protein